MFERLENFTVLIYVQISKPPELAPLWKAAKIYVFIIHPPAKVRWGNF
jgi:hypothetical protein